MAKTFLSFYLGLFLAVFLLWILLTGSFSADELWVGVLVAMGVTLATPRTSIFSGFKLSRHSPAAIIQYLFHFFLALIKANLDMARRVLTPSLPLNPAVVEIKTELQSDLGRLLLANSITLTPGTLTVDVSGERLIVHWVDSQPGEDIEHATRAIASDFERHIKGFLN